MGINPRNLQIRPAHGLVAGAVATGLMIAGTAFGVYCDLVERNRMTHYRGKSKMFGQEQKEGDPPAWGGDYWKVPDCFFKFK